jgi:hypothetical protein
MPNAEALWPAVLIALVLVVMLWFTFGTQRNIRKGNALLAWLQDGGLPVLGRRATLRWLGSSAVELVIAEASPPFRDATVVVVLEPRDVGLLWAFARSRGRRDFLIVRANLRRAPRFRLDAGDPGGWTGRLDSPSEDVRAGDADRRLAWPGNGLAVAGPGADDELARRAWERLARVSEGVWRLTIQPVTPHLEVHLRPPATERVSADRVIAPIRDLAAELAAH